jgi:UDP-N-acetylglucosamine 4,6-dehydratase
MAMEKIFQEFARSGHNTQFHLVRYGNVLESTGSVIEMWHRAVADGRPIRITDPTMTRFWLSPSQAVDYVIQSFGFSSGVILVPLMPALSIGDLATWVVGNHPMERIHLRPGEKMHETLVTIEETHRLGGHGDPTFVLVLPSTVIMEADPLLLREPYTSATARGMSVDELSTLLADE